MCIINRELTIAERYGNTTKKVLTDDGGHIPISEIYTDFVEDFSNARAVTLAQHRSIYHAIDMERSNNLPCGCISIEHNGLELNGDMLSEVARYLSHCIDSGHRLKSGIMDFD